MIFFIITLVVNSKEIKHFRPQKKIVRHFFFSNQTHCLFLFQNLLDLWRLNNDKKDLLCPLLDNLASRSEKPCSNCKQEICQHGKVILTDEPLPVGLEVRIVGSGDKGWVGKSTIWQNDEFGDKQIESKVLVTSERIYSWSSKNFSFLQYNCKPTSFRSQIPRTLSSTGCSNCRMETCLKGEEVEDACLFVGTKVFLTGTNIKAVVSKIVEDDRGYYAELRGVTFVRKFCFSREFSLFSYDCQIEDDRFSIRS